LAELASLTYNLKKYLRFVAKKPTIQLQLMQLKVRKTAGLLKTYFHEIKSGFLCHYIFANFYVKLKNNLL
jgi:hypothetical protein